MDKGFAVLEIDPEFKTLIRPLRKDEYLQLEVNLTVDGCREPIITWNNIIIDGHNRYEICNRLHIPYPVCRCLGIRQRRVYPRQLHHRLPPRRTVHIRYLCHIESALCGLFERRDMNHNPALPLRQGRIFLFYRQNLKRS